MVKKQSVDDFFEQQVFAVVGVSRTGRKFGNNAYKELKQKGFRVYQIHPQSKSIDGEECYPDFKSAPKDIKGVIVSIKPIHTLKILQEALESGIKHVWLQQGSESKEAIDFCIKNGINVIHGECIMMFAQPVKSIHRFHRWIWGAVGKLPK